MQEFAAVAHSDLPLQAFPPVHLVFAVSAAATASGVVANSTAAAVANATLEWSLRRATARSAMMILGKRS
jgi:hypothetical protein